MERRERWVEMEVGYGFLVLLGSCLKSRFIHR